MDANTLTLYYHCGDKVSLNTKESYTKLMPSRYRRKARVPGRLHWQLNFSKWSLYDISTFKAYLNGYLC